MVVLTGPAMPRHPRAVTRTDDTDPMPVRRAYKLRAYPTRPQEDRAVKLLRDHCDLYNAALQERREAWRMRRVCIAYRDQSAQLKEILAADPDGQGRHSFTAQQQTLRRLFVAFLKRIRDAEQTKQRRVERKVGYPRFKPYSGSTRSCSSPGTAPSGTPPPMAAGACQIPGGRPGQGQTTPAGESYFSSGPLSSSSLAGSEFGWTWSNAWSASLGSSGIRTR